MRSIITGILLILFSVADAQSTTRVKGYRKKNGTYVAPHTKTKSNKTQRDNYSTKGNTNPYTGKRGKKKAKK